VKPIRRERVAAFLRNEIARLIQVEIQDPRVGFISVTRVKPTDDFKEATVYVSMMGSPGEKRTALRGLESARAFLQQRLATTHSWRQNPVLRFELDESIEKSMNMEDLIERARAEDIANARDRDQDDGAGAAQ